jgi:phosphoribosyl-ATP pyrophosphohydrolase/phosphoribosyl-AMP cyclohydrolase
LKITRPRSYRGFFLLRTKKTNAEKKDSDDYLNIALPKGRLGENVYKRFAKAEDKKETIYEIADLTYHIMVLMTQAGITIEDINRELASRHVIDKKIKQEKMT